jgi:asparagine synthase (glutamine-hydrolysing)
MFSNYWHDAVRRELLPDAPGCVLARWRHSWLEGAFNHANNAFDRMLWLDSHTYLPDCLLVKMDIASMHCGLETRSPLLDHLVIEFCASLPVHYKVKHQMNKYLLKKLAERHYPASFVRRPKQGFAVPLTNWLRGPLRTTLNQTLRDSRLMAPLSAPVIERTLRQFDEGNDGHQHRLWALLMFGCWRKVHDYAV